MYHFIVGTKAQLVKIAPVIREFDQKKISYELIFTGQHKETMDDLLSCFEIKKPNVILYSHSEADSVFKLVKWLVGSSRNFYLLRTKFKSSNGFIIHGDTLSTLMGGVWAKLIKVKTIHIEAGLRSNNLLSPFPEEIIRRLVTRLSDVLFCPNEWSVENISVASANKVIINTYQNTLLDSIKFALIKNSNQISLDQPDYIIASIHRSENVMNKKHFFHILELIKIAAKKYPIKLVLHPITRRKIIEYNLENELITNNIETVQRMDYVSFINLLSNSKALLSDGGSNQEESSYLGLPCLVMRKETERMEGIGETAIVSNLDSSIVEKFVDDIGTHTLKVNCLPNIYPSAIISKYLSQCSK